MTFSNRLSAFFFARRSATGWGLMRILWALTMLFAVLCILPDLPRYASDAGFLPRALEPLILRNVLRFSAFDIVTTPAGTWILGTALCISLLLMALGIFPRASTIVSVLLTFSLHERNPLVLGGGETLIRMLGFFLMIAPGIEALSVARLRLQWQSWKREKHFLEPLTMPTWPKRLLLWQILLVYLMTFWSKLTGMAWIEGSAVGLILLNPTFSRFAPWITPSFASTISPFVTYVTLLFELSWAFLLAPRTIVDRIPFLKNGRLRRLFLALGILFHLGIWLILRVGFFFPAMMTAYAGLLEQEDFDAIRTFFNRRWRGTIAVLHDGHCGLCRRSVITLYLLDSLSRLRFIDFHDTASKNAVAPDLKFANLDKALHIRLPNGRTEKSYRAFRVLAHHLPLLWPLVPLLYLPGAAPTGERIYAWVAAKRKKCTHENCQL